MDVVVPLQLPECVSAVLAPSMRAPLCLPVLLPAAPAPLLDFSRVPGLPEGMPLFIKREDVAASGTELGGNKARKLSFLLADAKSRRCDTAVVFGTPDSNSCRAAAFACARVQLRCHCVLVEDGAAANEGLEHSANAALIAMAGASTRRIPWAEYQERGGIGKLDEILAAESERVARDSHSPASCYPIPMGGSSAVGMLGGVHLGLELLQQLGALPKCCALAAGATEQLRVPPPLHVVVPVGSGSSYAGLALVWSAVAASTSSAPSVALPARSGVRGYCVHSTVGAFEGTVARLYAAAGCNTPTTDGRACSSLHDAAGEGYARVTDAERQFHSLVCRATGVLLDGTYTNKALFGFVNDVASERLPRGPSIFVHTGGQLGLFSIKSAWK